MTRRAHESSRLWGSEPRSTLLIKAETQVGGLDAEPPDGGPGLGSFWQSGGRSLSVTGINPVSPLVLPMSPGTSRDRCFCSPVAGSEAARISDNQIEFGHLVRCEGVQSLSPVDSPVLAIPDVVLRASLHSRAPPMGDSTQERPAVSTPEQNLAPSPEIGRLWMWPIKGNRL